MVLREPPGASSGRLVASLSVDIERVVSVQGIRGCVSIPLLMLLPCTVFDVGVVVKVTFSVKINKPTYRSWSNNSILTQIPNCIFWYTNFVHDIYALHVHKVNHWIRMFARVTVILCAPPFLHACILVLADRPPNWYYLIAIAVNTQIYVVSYQWPCWRVCSLLLLEVL